MADRCSACRDGSCVLASPMVRSGHLRNSWLSVGVARTCLSPRILCAHQSPGLRVRDSFVGRSNRLYLAGRNTPKARVYLGRWRPRVHGDRTCCVCACGLSGLVLARWTSLPIHADVWSAVPDDDIHHRLARISCAAAFGQRVRRSCPVVSGWNDCGILPRRYAGFGTCCGWGRRGSIVGTRNNVIDCRVITASPVRLSCSAFRERSGCSRVCPPLPVRS